MRTLSVSVGVLLALLPVGTSGWTAPPKPSPSPGSPGPAIETDTPTVTAPPPMIFKRVDFFVPKGEKEKKIDVRLVLDYEARTIIIADEKRGTEIFVTIPFGAVTELAYEKSKHRRWKSAIFLTPWAIFTKGKKHWFTIGFEGLEEFPQNYTYVRLDKKNYQRVLAAVEAATGITASRTETE